MALAMMQKGNLDAVQSDVHGRIAKETVGLEGVSVTRVAFHPGARWSEDLKAYAGTESHLPGEVVCGGGRRPRRRPHTSTGKWRTSTSAALRLRARRPIGR
jgi:hypothetical protein